MKVIVLSKKSFKKEVKIALDVLQNGGVIVCPTDTVYGLLANATNRKAVQKVFLIKGREKGKPLPIFVKDIVMAKILAKVSLLQGKYMKKVWPGKTTLILKSKGVLPKETGTKEFIGIRIPKHKFIQAILKEIDIPLTGTSANLARKPSLADSKDIIEVFDRRKHKPDIVIDAGKLPYPRPSKVIDITKTKPKVLRK